MAYDAGQAITLRAEFRNKAGALEDPTNVTVTTKAPDGTVTSYTDALHPSVGVYEKDVVLDQAGRWWVRIAGTGAVAAVDEHALDVNPSVVV